MLKRKANEKKRKKNNARIQKESYSTKKTVAQKRRYYKNKIPSQERIYDG